MHNLMWLNDEIKEGIKIRDKLYYRARKYQTDEDWTNYRTARNKVTTTIRNAKKNYFSNKFQENNITLVDFETMIKCLSNDNPEKKT